jgi:hypothetical protein
LVIKWEAPKLLTNDNISTKVIDKAISTGRIEIDNTTAIDCTICKSTVIAEYNAKLDLMHYDFEYYYFNNLKITHGHLADTKTKNRILERLKMEKRLLHDIDPGDYCYGKEDADVRQW